MSSDQTLFNGIGTILIYDTDKNGQIKSNPKCITKRNVINKRSVERLFMSNASVFTDAQRIAISTDNYTPNYERTQVQNVIAIGDPNLSGVTGYVFTPESQSFPANGTYHNRFLQPAAPRSFDTVAIVDGTTNNNTSNITSSCYSFLSFPSSVTQGITQIIDIFYKVYIDWQNNPLNIRPNFQKELEFLFFDQIDSGIQYEDHNGITWLMSPNQSDPDMVTRAVEGESYSESYTGNTAFLKRKYSLTMTFGTDRIYGGLAYGRLERSGTNLNSFKSTAGVIPVQSDRTLTNVFSHSASASALWYDGNALAGSTYKPIVTDNAGLVNQLPTLYALKVIAPGGVGIGTFKIYKTLYSGGDNNVTFGQRPRPLHVTQKYPDFFPEDNDIPYNTKWIYEWTDVIFWVSGRDTTVAIWSIYPEFTVDQSWDLASESVTIINDIATDFLNELIYVATEEGLYKIDPNEIPANQVTQLSSDRAKAVDVGYNGTVFAVLIDISNVGRLASSLNVSWADAHSFTGSMTFNNVLFIRCDRGSADHRLAILEYFRNPLSGYVVQNRDDNTVGKIHWWDLPNGYTGSPIDCQSKVNAGVYYHKAFNYPYNSSFVVKSSEGANPATWVYMKFYYFISSVHVYTRGYSGEQARILAEGGINLVDANENFDTTNRNITTIGITGAARFNQEIRASNYQSSGNIYASASYSIIDNDLSNGKISVLIGGWYASGTSSGYSSSALNRSGGIFDLDINLSNPNIYTYSTFRNQGINVFTFTYYSYESGSSQGYYGCTGNVQSAKGLGILNFNDSGVSTKDYAFGGGYKQQNTHFQPLLIGIWGTRGRGYLFSNSYNAFREVWAWNPTLNGGAGDWEIDPDDSGQGKPLYVGTVEDLIDGLQLEWIDLAPLESVPTSDLVQNEFYTWVWVPGGVALVGDGTLPGVSLSFYYHLRPTVIENVSDTVPATPHQVTLSAASSDPDWFRLDPDGDDFDVTIAGYSDPATIITSGSPQPNEILLVDTVAGTFEFNPTDEAKSYSGSILYGKKIHPTEV